MATAKMTIPLAWALRRCALTSVLSWPSVMRMRKLFAAEPRQPYDALNTSKFPLGITVYLVNSSGHSCSDQSAATVVGNVEDLLSHERSIRTLTEGEYHKSGAGEADEADACLLLL